MLLGPRETILLLSEAAAPTTAGDPLGKSLVPCSLSLDTNLNRSCQGQHYAKLLANAGIKVYTHNLAKVSIAGPAAQHAKTARTWVLSIYLRGLHIFLDLL